MCPKRATAWLALVALAAADGLPELWGAVSQGSVEEVQDVLASGRVNASRDEDVDALIYNVTAEGRGDVLRLLIDFWPDGATVTASGETLLHLAARSGHLEVLQLLLDRWPPGPPGEPPAIAQRDGEGSTLLHVAASGGQVRILGHLLERWPAEASSPMTVAAEKGEVPLHRAVMSNQLEVAGFLLERWPEGAAFQSECCTCFHYAAGWGYVEMLELLLEVSPAGVKVTSPDREQWTAMHSAAAAGQLRTLQVLLEHWPEAIRIRDQSLGWTPLQLAAAIGSFEAAVFLLELPGGYDPRTDPLHCSFVLYLGCSVEDPRYAAWREAAVNLECPWRRELKKDQLELWLRCGGDVGFRDPFGASLLDVLADEEAKSFFKTAVEGTTEAHLFADWRNWAIPAFSVVAAAVFVCFEQLVAKLCRRAPDGDVVDPFQEGAKLLVGRAYLGFLPLRRLVHFLEVNTAVWLFGTGFLVMHWLVWLPLVALFYFVPAAAFHGWALLRYPSLAIASSGLASHVAAFVRLLLVVLVFTMRSWVMSVGYGTLHSFPSSLLFNPSLDEWGSERYGSLWEDTSMSLQNDQFLFWLGPVTAQELFDNVIVPTGMTLAATRAAYLVGAIAWAVCHRLMGWKGESCRSGMPSREETARAVSELLKSEPAQFREVHSAIKPVRACTLYLTVAWILVDVGLDTNTVLIFASKRQYLFASLMTFVASRSMIRQICFLKPWHLLQAFHECCLCVCDVCACVMYVMYVSVCVCVCT